MANLKSKIDFLEEGMSIIKEADKKGITVRLLGAVAIRQHCPKFRGLHEKLGRELSDIDVVGYARESREIERLLTDRGYARHLSPSMMTAARRIFVDSLGKPIVDVFLDKLIMCHTIDFRKRLEVDHPTVPLADLLLAKMQIVELTEKDAKDMIVLIKEHDVINVDHETVNCKYIAQLLSNDWGFYYTVTTNLKKVQNLLPKYDFSQEDKVDISSKINEILETIEKEPKSFRWRARAKIGTKKLWYRKV